MCSPKLHVEVNSFGLQKKWQADLMCKSNQRHLEPTLEYETTLPSPTNLKERIKMRSMHLYQTFSGIPPTHPHPHPPIQQLGNGLLLTCDWFVYNFLIHNQTSPPWGRHVHVNKCQNCHHWGGHVNQILTPCLSPFPPPPPKKKQIGKSGQTITGA